MFNLHSIPGTKEKKSDVKLLFSCVSVKIYFLNSALFRATIKYKPDDSRFSIHLTYCTDNEINAFYCISQKKCFVHIYEKDEMIVSVCNE